MKVKSEREVTQLRLTLHDPMDRSLPGSSVHGIFQARVLEWVAIAFSGEEGELVSKHQLQRFFWTLNGFKGRIIGGRGQSLHLSSHVCNLPSHLLVVK